MNVLGDETARDDKREEINVCVCGLNVLSKKEWPSIILFFLHFVFLEKQTIFDVMTF